jgi:hypothetical protein
VRQALILSALILFVALPGYSQDAPSTFHVFPQFADGKLGGGTYYTTKVMIRSGNDNAPIATTCFLDLNGMTSQMDNGAVGTVFQYSVPAGGFAISQTTGTQNFQQNLATLNCSDVVFAQLLFTSYAANGSKIGEATIFSTTQRPVNAMLFDYRNGGRFAIAIANATASPHTYGIFVTGNFPTLVNTVVVGPNLNVTFNLDEKISLPANTVGQVRIRSADFTNAAVIGFQYTGSLFTTVPAN